MKFSDFYFEFIRLFSHLDQIEDILLRSLKRKISPRLLQLWNIFSLELDTLETVKKYMSRVDNAQRQ